MKFLKSILAITTLARATAASAGLTCAERVPADTAISKIRLMSGFLEAQYNLPFDRDLSVSVTTAVRREISSNTAIAVVNDGVMRGQPTTIALIYSGDVNKLCVNDSRSGSRDWSQQLLRLMFKDVPGARIIP